MSKQYLVHLCSIDGKECREVWIDADSTQDPEQIALDQYQDVDAVRLLFDENGDVISRKGMKS